MLMMSRGMIKHRILFSAIKRVFGDSVRGKTQTSMRNESLCKCLCHNICVLIHAMHEFGIELNLRAELPLARQFPFARKIVRLPANSEGRAQLAGLIGG
jgi:hypothetical protein